MPYIIILIGFIFLLYAISRFMQKSKSPKLNKLFRYGFAAILGVLAFLIIFRGNVPAGMILGLLSYLSARGSLWRFLVNGPAASADAPPSITPMKREEALEILGLSGNPSQDEIKDAHHKMMLKVHPDQGGSDYFASKLNQARDILLN